MLFSVHTLQQTDKGVFNVQLPSNSSSTSTCSRGQELTFLHVAPPFPLFLFPSLFFHRLFLRPPPSTLVVHVAFSESL